MQLSKELIPNRTSLQAKVLCIIGSKGMCGKVQAHNKDRTSRSHMVVDYFGCGPGNHPADCSRVLLMAQKN
jgi:hypothetical protein